MNYKLHFILFLLSLSVSSFGQGTRLSVSEITVSTSNETLSGKDVEIPFIYGKWSPKMELVNSGGTIVKASFKLTSNRNARSEMKNSSVQLFVFYEVIHAGTKREKKAEHIYYLDDQRNFESEETFSFKPTRYEVKILKLKFKANLGE